MTPWQRARAAAGLAGCVAASLCAAQDLGGAAVAAPVSVASAYYDSREVTVKFAPAPKPRRRSLVPLRRTASDFSFGPWTFGARLRQPKPVDGRPNLYIVVPGEEHGLAAAPAYNHSVVLDSLTPKGAATGATEPQPIRQWDVY